MTNLRLSPPWHLARLLLLTVAGAVASVGVQASSTAGSLAVTAAVLTKHNCTFNSKALTLNFGAIDPASSANVTATASTVFVCKGGGNVPIASYAITANDGLYSSVPGARRMRHSTLLTQFMGYALTLSPALGTATKNVNQTLTITGTMTPADFQDAAAGPYSDTVVLTINP